MVTRYEKTDYNMESPRQNACININPIMLDSFASLFYCTVVDFTSN